VPSQTGLIKDGTTSIACLLVFVDTDEGITGETILFSFNPAHLPVFAALLRMLEDVVIGEDPRETERLWELLRLRTAFFGSEGLAVFGRSAIDRACWDIAGKAAGLAVHRMLGAFRASVPAYASGLWLSMDHETLVAEAARYLDQGFRAIKMRIGSPRLTDDVERVRVVREAIGPDVRLMVDANKRLTVDRAIRLGRALKPYDLAWFEEPVPAHDLEGSARIAAALDVPIASGESEFTRSGFRRLRETGAASIFMPDMGRVGGISEMVKVAHFAAAYDIPVTPHNYPHESLQILGSIANGSYVECLPWFYPVYREQIVVTDGQVAVPDAPGMGSSFDPAAIEHYRVE
jgi:L-alanine-DL-glutamate epimerase-like enolase superfamily enzyme